MQSRTLSAVLRIIITAFALSPVVAQDAKAAGDPGKGTVSLGSVLCATRSTGTGPMALGRPFSAWWAARQAPFQISTIRGLSNPRHLPTRVRKCSVRSCRRRQRRCAACGWECSRASPTKIARTSSLPEISEIGTSMNWYMNTAAILAGLAIGTRQSWIKRAGSTLRRNRARQRTLLHTACPLGPLLRADLRAPDGLPNGA